MDKRILSTLIILILLLFDVSITNSQTDTLTLNDAIQKVIQNYPSVKQMEESINGAGIKVDLAETGYYPNIDVDASYTRLGPLSSIAIPMLGSFDLYPANNYSASLSISENIFDFGKTSRNVDYQKENRNYAGQNLEQVKQSLALRTINSVLNIAYLQEAIEIAIERLKDLQDHLDFVTKKKETGSAIKYEILTTQVRISNTESQKIDFESNLKIQQSILNSLLGKPAYSSNYIKNDTVTPPLEVQNDSLLSYAMNNRIELRIAKEKSNLAELNYRIAEVKNYPTINLFATGGWKNGFFPDLNTLTANFAAGVGITIPVFDFGRNKNNILLTKSTIKEDNYELDAMKRRVETEVIESIENLKAAQKKMDQFELQLKQAEEAYSLAEINFRDGAITNLDLLDASTNVSESRLLLLKSKIDFLLNTYKLKSSLGMRLY